MIFHSTKRILSASRYFFEAAALPNMLNNPVASKIRAFSETGRFLHEMKLLMYLTIAVEVNMRSSNRSPTGRLVR